MNIKKLFFLIFWLIPLLIWGRGSAEALEACAATNDLRGLKNTGNLHLKPGSTYELLRRHKGHYLIRWEGQGQRWVPERCLKSIHSSHRAAAKIQKSRRDSGLPSLLVLSWHNAFCETHPNRKECRPLANPAANHLVLHGLWPQPRSRVYCNIPSRWRAADRQKRWRAIPSLDLPADLRQRLVKAMPGALSGLERHEWVKHGSCYDPDPVRYFSDAVSLTEQVDRSLVGEYLRANVGRRVTLLQLRRLFERSFGKGTGSRLAMECRRGLLSELKISLRGKGSDLRQLLEGAPSLRSRCREGIVDAPGAFRRR
ncbi:ribonuclease T2 family protein [Nitratifractor sp.]